MLNEIITFFKNPVYQRLSLDGKQKIKYFLGLTLLAVLTSLGLGLLMEGIASLIDFDLENHAVLEMLDQFSPIMIFFAAVIVAPILEELFFRAPLGLFKKSTYFKYAYYISVVLFGLIHISNFPNIEGFYWLIPVLIAPQIFAGIYLGYCFTKLGLFWSILLHALHNLILIGPYIVMKIFNISL